MVNAHFTKGIFFLHVFVYEKKTLLSPMKVQIREHRVLKTQERNQERREIYV